MKSLPRPSRATRKISLPRGAPSSPCRVPSPPWKTAISPRIGHRQDLVADHHRAGRRRLVVILSLKSTSPVFGSSIRRTRPGLSPVKKHVVFHQHARNVRVGRLAIVPRLSRLRFSRSMAIMKREPSPSPTAITIRPAGVDRVADHAQRPSSPSATRRVFPVDLAGRWIVGGDRVVVPRISSSGLSPRFRM